MENLIRIVIGTTILVISGLLGLVWKNNDERIKNLESRKVDNKTCNILHSQVKEDLNYIKSSNEDIHKQLVEIKMQLAKINGMPNGMPK